MQEINIEQVEYIKTLFNNFNWERENSINQIENIHFQSDLNVLLTQLSQLVVTKKERETIINMLRGSAKINAEELLQKYTLLD